MSNLLSSPSKQAQQSASAVEGVDQGEIDQTESYVANQQQQERDAIAGLGQNPYFAAAQQLQPQKFNPASTISFGSSGTGTTLAPTNTFSGAGVNQIPTTGQPSTRKST